VKSDHHASLVPDGGRHSGLRESVVLRGMAAERGPGLATKYVGRNPAPRAKGQRRNKQFQGCSRSLKKRRGTFTYATCGSRWRERRVLRSRFFGPCSSAPLSNSRRRKRRLGLGVARKRRQGWAVASGSEFFGVLAASRGRCRKNCRGSQALMSFFVRGSPWSVKRPRK